MVNHPKDEAAKYNIMTDNVEADKATEKPKVGKPKIEDNDKPTNDNNEQPEPVRSQFRQWIIDQELTPRRSPLIWLLLNIACFCLTTGTFIAVLIVREETDDPEQWSDAMVKVFLSESFISTLVWCIQVVLTILDEYDVEEYIEDPELFIDDSQRPEETNGKIVFQKIPCDTKIEALLAITFTVVTARNFADPRSEIDSVFGLVEMAINALAFLYEGYECVKFMTGSNNEKEDTDATELQQKRTTPPEVEMNA